MLLSACSSNCLSTTHPQSFAARSSPPAGGRHYRTAATNHFADPSCEAQGALCVNILEWIDGVAAR